MTEVIDRTITIDDELVIDTFRATVKVDGVEVKISRQEYAALLMLAVDPEHHFTIEQLMEHAGVTNREALWVLMFRIRKKVGHRFVHNKHNGYSLLPLSPIPHEYKKDVKREDDKKRR